MIVVAALVWSVSSASAASVSLDVDASQLFVGQSTHVTVTVEDASPTAVPSLLVPEGLQVQYVGQSTRQGLTVDLAGKAHTRRTTGYQFQVLATTEGAYTLGPASVEIGTSRMVTGTQGVTVAAAPAAGQSRLRASAGFDVTEAYEGEVVVYRYEVDYKDPVVRSNWHLPAFDGFVAPRDGDRPRNVGQIDGPDGRETIDRTHVPLVAAKAGTHEVGGAVVTVEIATGQRPTPPVRFDPLRVFGDLMQATRSDAVATGPATLTVKPLPPPPEAFSALVGDFEVGLYKAPAAPIRVPVGKSVEFTVEVKGDGALEGFTLSPPPEVDGLRNYDGAPLADAVVRDGRYNAIGRYERVVVPTRVGTFEVPPVTIVAFSPTKGTYVTHTVGLGTIEAVPGEAQGGGVASFAEGAPPEVATAPEDIRDVRLGRARMPSVGPLLPVGLAVAGLPGLLFAAAEVLGVLVARRKAREKPPRPRPLDRLARLPADRTERLQALDMAIREALALRADVAVVELDRDAATSALPDDLQQTTLHVTRDLDRARFGGQDDGLLVDRVTELVIRITP